MIAERFEELGINFNYSAFAISALISSLLFLVAGYAFRSVGVYVMSKKQGLSTPWLSFVPFLGYVQLGKLIGPAKIFGMRMKNVGWLVFAFLLANTAAEAAYDVLYCWKDFLFIIVENKIPATTEATIGEYILVGVNYLLSLGYIVAFVFTAILSVIIQKIPSRALPFCRYFLSLCSEYSFSFAETTTKKTLMPSAVRLKKN